MISLNAIKTRKLICFEIMMMLLLLAVVVAVRVRLLDVPFERDEGEYAYMGQLLLKGVPPFVNAYTMKLPGTSMVYAAFMAIFGQTVPGIHLGFLITNLLSSGLVWLLARRLFGMRAATMATMVFAMLTLSQSLLGVFAHATHFVVLFALIGILLLLRFLDDKNPLLIAASGLCFGVAVTMKQHAAFLLAFALIYLLWNAYKSSFTWKLMPAMCGLFLFCAALPLAAIAIWMAKAGVFGKFWFWTVEYARDYVGITTMTSALSTLKFKVKLLAPYQLPMWLAAIAGGILLLTRRGAKTDRLLVFGLLLSGLLAVSPGFYFRNHYFVLILVPVALLAGFAVTESGNVLPAGFPPWLRQAVPTVLIMVLVGYGLYNERLYLFTYSSEQVNRSTYGGSPFVESVEVARYIEEHSAPNDRIAVLGSEPQIYFYAHRVSATGFIYMYGLMEEQPHAERMWRDMAGEIEAAKPTFVVVVDTQDSWFSSNMLSKAIPKGFRDYIVVNYQLVDTVDIYYDYTIYAVGAEPQYPLSIKILKRKPKPV